MAFLDLLISSFSSANKAIGELEIDVVTSEVITFSSETTDHPIESGADITDHTINKPVQIKMSCVVGGSNLTNWEDKRADGYEALKALRDARTPISVVTGLEVFTNMIITDIQIDRSVSNSSNLSFEIMFKNITIVESQKKDLSNNISENNKETKDRASTTKDKGRVQEKKTTSSTTSISGSTSASGSTSTTSPTQKSKSVLKEIFG